VIKSDGTLWGVGDNLNGALGDGTTQDRTSFVFIDRNVTEAATGERFTFYVKSDGRMYAMGMNDFGQLGDGTTYGSSNPCIDRSQCKFGDSWKTVMIYT
jgi:alpha-tubulin suppressor-like RCC1 family protein